jgi:hypothetical protein
MIHIPAEESTDSIAKVVYTSKDKKSRGMRKKAGTDDTIPAVMPNEMSSKEFRQNWARLIQKNL